MKISFIIPNFRKPFTQFPVGTLNIASILHAENHEVNITDLRIDDIEKHLHKIKQADVIFVVSTTYDFIQCYGIKSDLKLTKEIVKVIKTFNDCKIYLIGAHGTVLPKATLKMTKVDGIIRGEFEDNVYYFINSFSKYKNMKIFPSSKIKVDRYDLNNLRVDYSLINVDKYYGEIVNDNKVEFGKTALILGNRGCPYRCDFCHVIFNDMVMRKPINVFKDIRNLYKKYSTRNFFFLDYTFTANKRWVMELCNLIIESKMDISWICQTRFDIIEQNTLQIMKNAGCSGIWYGIENPFSYFKNKNKTKEDMERIIKMTQEIGIIPFLFLLFQMPNEKVSDVLQINKWLNKMKAYFVASKLLPRPGTKLFKEISGEKMVEELSWDAVFQALEKNWNSLEDKKIYEEIFEELENNRWHLMNYNLNY